MNWPAVAPVRPKTLVLAMPAESGIGTPRVNGSSIRAAPVILPGYNASRTVSGTFSAAHEDHASVKSRVEHFNAVFIYLYKSSTGGRTVLFAISWNWSLF
jgi:hypothetical protein